MRLTLHARLGRYIANKAREGQKQYWYIQLFSFHHPPPLPPSPPPPPRLKAKFKNDLVLKDGDEQHDAEPRQHAQVLQDEMSKLAALVVLAVPVKHFWQLWKRQSNRLGSETGFSWSWRSREEDWLPVWERWQWKLSWCRSGNGYCSGAVECTVPTHHIDEGNVKEHASCGGEDPVGDTVRVLAHGCADYHANVSHEGGQQVVDDGLLHRHPGFQQHRKVTCQPGKTHTETLKRG